MESIRFVNIASYATGPEAHLVRNELEAAGIPAQVIGETAVGAIWYVGSALGGVKVMVAEKDAPAARKVLAELELLSSPIDESFDGYDTVEDSDESLREDALDEETAREHRASTNPYHSPQTAAGPNADDEGAHDAEADERLANRIWRAAVFGPIFCPPALSLYSVFLLLANCDLFGRIDSKHKWKLWGAVMVNAFVFGVFMLGAWGIYFLSGQTSPDFPGDAEPFTREVEIDLLP